MAAVGQSSVTMWQLWNPYGSLWGHNVAAVESLWVTIGHYVAAMWQLWNPCGSLWGHYVAAVESLLGHYKVTIWQLQDIYGSP